MKKRVFSLLLVLALLLPGCTATAPTAQIVATTKPVYDFASALCSGTDLEVGLLISDSVSCLHDYSLSVSQVRSAEAAQVMVISGAGLEEFMEDILDKAPLTIDSSQGISLLESTVEHDHDHEHSHAHDHDHEADAHIWLSPSNAQIMAKNICNGLCGAYPSHAATFEKNLTALLEKLEALRSYGETTLQDLSCRELITFHDGFAYLADAFGLEIIAAVEEESGSEASAKDLINLIEEVVHHNLPAIFTEVNGSVSAAGIIAAETGAGVFTLNMSMSDGDYFENMYHNIDTLKEALG